MSKPKRMRPAFKAMIVAPQPEAAEAGLTVLDAGGNALDAGARLRLRPRRGPIR